MIVKCYESSGETISFVVTDLQHDHNMYFELIGWAGAFLFIFAYFLLSTGKLGANDKSFQLMNILGGICLVVNAYHLNDYPTLVTNLSWAGIGLFAYIKLLNLRKA